MVVDLLVMVVRSVWFGLVIPSSGWLVVRGAMSGMVDGWGRRGKARFKNRFESYRAFMGAPFVQPQGSDVARSPIGVARSMCWVTAQFIRKPTVGQLPVSYDCLHSIWLLKTDHSGITA